MESIGLFNTYFLMDSLILWHLPKKFMVPPLTTITWHSGAGSRKQFNSLAILQLIKLWVLPESINTITFYFLICPSIFIVWGVVIPINALQDMVGFISSLCGVGSWWVSFYFDVSWYFSSWYFTAWTFFFLICPSILRVWGVVIPAIAIQDMVGFICSHKPLVMWSIFTEEMIAHYEDTKSNTTTIAKSKRALWHIGK